MSKESTNIRTFKEYVVKKIKASFMFFVSVSFVLAIILLLFELMSINNISKVKFSFRNTAMDELRDTNSPQTMINDNFLLICVNGSLQEINEAIAYGANVNAKGSSGVLRDYTPLMITTNPEAIVALINAGADVNARDVLGNTPLMYVSRSNPEAIRIFANAGADVNAKNDSGKTSLMFAAQFSSDPQVITTLLQFGADPKMVDSNGVKAINYAKDNRNLRNTETLRRLEEVSR
jgi:ankyrin repeat protein